MSEEEIKEDLRFERIFGRIETLIFIISGFIGAWIFDGLFF